MPSEGRVEIMINDEWGTVCDDDFDIIDATIICRSLGFEGAVEALSNAHFGEGEGSIMLDNVRCTDQESNVLECGHNGLKEHDCDHSEDASVICIAPSKYCSFCSPGCTFPQYCPFFVVALRYLHFNLILFFRVCGLPNREDHGYGTAHRMCISQTLALARKVNIVTQTSSCHRQKNLRLTFFSNSMQLKRIIHKKAVSSKYM